MSDPPKPGRLRDILLAKALLKVTRRLPGSDGDKPSVPGVPPPNVERSLESTRGAELLVVAALLLTAVAAAGFIVFYVVFPDTQLLGLTIGLALLFLAVAAIVAGKKVVPQETTVEQREDFGDAELQEEVFGIVKRGGEGVSRRGMILGAAGAAGATVGAAALFPLASLGPRVDDRLRQSPWRKGRRVVDADGAVIKVGDVEIGGFKTAFPEGATRNELSAPIILVKLHPEEIELPEAQKAAMPQGVIGFSKICPHAGCAVSMYRHPLYEPTATKPALVCPCHYSTFDVRRGGELIFGPAGRALPRLPLTVNADDELVADGDYLETYGPSWSGVRQAPGTT